MVHHHTTLSHHHDAISSSSSTDLLSHLDILVSNIKSQLYSNVVPTTSSSYSPLILSLVTSKNTTSDNIKSTKNSLYLSFPSNHSSHDSRSFAIYLQLLCYIRNLLRTNLIATKRDLYYRNVTLFQSQSVVDRAIDTISRALNVDRLQLNVVASPKSCIYGSVTIIPNHSKEIIQLSNNSLIPVDISISYIRIPPDITTILVIEKEAVYRQLCGQLPNSILLVTAKGFPDLSCRRFLHSIGKFYPDVAIKALIDSDPWGIHIFLSFKFGINKSSSNRKKRNTGFFSSRSRTRKCNNNNIKRIKLEESLQRHSNDSNSGYDFKNGDDNNETLVEFQSNNDNNNTFPVPNLQFLGVSLLDYNIVSQMNKQNNKDTTSTTWLKMSQKDIQMAFNLLQQPWAYSCSKEFFDIKRELQLSLFLNKKAEMNTVFSSSTDKTNNNDNQDNKCIVDYVKSKLNI